MFHKLLRETACEVAAYLRKGNRNPKELLVLFSGFRVSFDPRRNWKYRTDGNAFVINLLSLLYTPPWRLASALVHETEHVLFLKRKGMINAPESEQERFGEKFTRDMEIRAVKAERDFLLTIKRHVPPEIHVYVTKEEYRIYTFNDVLSMTIRTLRFDSLSMDTLSSYIQPHRSNFWRVSVCLHFFTDF